MDALEAAADDGIDAEELPALGRPVARAAGTVFFAGEDHGRRTARDVGHGGVVNRHLLAFRLQDGDSALDAPAIRLRRQHQILDAHVSEGAAHHHLVIATAAAVAVEVWDADVVLEQIDARRRSGLDRSRWADVIRSHRIAENAEDASATNRGGRPGLHGEVLEEWRLGDISGLVP